MYRGLVVEIARVGGGAVAIVCATGIGSGAELRTARVGETARVARCASVGAGCADRAVAVGRAVRPGVVALLGTADVGIERIASPAHEWSARTFRPDANVELASLSIEQDSLVRLLSAWRELPEYVRRTILGIVESVTK